MMRFMAWLFLLFAANAAAAQPSAAFTSDRISVETRGSGPDVVLIPGLTSSPRAWESTVAAVPGYRYHLVQVAGFAGAPAEANAPDVEIKRIPDAWHFIMLDEPEAFRRELRAFLGE